MTITLEATDLDYSFGSLLDWADALRVPVQDAMAYRLQDIISNNFGAGDGEDRPLPWQPLSYGYAKMAHAGDTTPTEILLGDLKDSISVEDGNPEASRVYTDNEYASVQQFGGGDWDIPARPFFPFQGNDPDAGLTIYSENELRDAAIESVSATVNK